MIDENKLLDDLVKCKELGRNSFQAVINLINSQPKIGEWLPIDKNKPVPGVIYELSCNIYGTEDVIIKGYFEKNGNVYYYTSDEHTRQLKELRSAKVTAFRKAFTTPYKKD